MVNKQHHTVRRPKVVRWKEAGYVRYTRCMLFMVIERFKDGNPKAVGERFKARGRMMPANVTYQMSWMELPGSGCYQVMEAPDREALAPWLHAWQDLVDFEVVPILTSADFWAAAAADRFTDQ